MNQCKCGSHAINPHCHGRESGVDLNLCDVCYWRTRAEAASACPVRVLNIFEGTYQSDRYIELRTDAEADTFTDWLRDRMKERVDQ